MTEDVHTGTWELRERSKRITQSLGVLMIFLAILGWFMGKTDGVAMALITNGVFLIGAVEINHTRSKVKADGGKP